MGRRRGNGVSSVGPDGPSRNERRGESGFVVYCKCEQFRSHSAELLRQQPWRKGNCKTCGALKREWRCPVHKLKATPLVRDDIRLGSGCARCGRGPREQKLDGYMTAAARMK